MKKILVVLLVLAVAGGVFAQQGEWGIGASARVGAVADFNEDPNVKVGSNDDGDWNWNNKGTLGISYTADSGLKAGVDFEVVQHYDSEESAGIGAYVEYWGDNYAFKVSAPLRFPLLNGSSITDLGGINDLWGYYKLLGGLVHLEGAYNGRDNTWWGSSDVYDGGWGNLLNGASGALLNVDIESLQFGIIVPNLFGKYGVELVKDALLQSVVGFKFSMSPIEFAANFKFEDYGVYFGGKWFVVPDVLTLGLNFKGLLKDGPIGAGAKVEYNADVFGASVGVIYQLKPDTAKYLKIAPSFYYNVLPDYFRFSTDLSFKFADETIYWGIEPAISWNFLGTGANGYTDLSTGMGVKFILNSEGAGTSKLWVGFKWGI